MSARYGTSCSWCHWFNWIIATPAYCEMCEHRADLCRAECDCPRCTCPPPEITPADIAAAREWLRTRRLPAARIAE